MTAMLTALIALLTAIITSMYQLRSSRITLEIAKINMTKEHTMGTPDKQTEHQSGRFSPRKYLWRKQKLAVFIEFDLMVLPYIQYRLTGTDSFSFLFVLVHCAILFYVVGFIICYFLLHEWTEFDWAARQKKRVAEANPIAPPSEP